MLAPWHLEKIPMCSGNFSVYLGTLYRTSTGGVHGTVAQSLRMLILIYEAFRLGPGSLTYR